MTQTFESGFKTTLSKVLDTADTTMYVATAPTVTAGRVYLTNGQQEEWISFTGVSGSTLTGLTRGLSQTADPATAGTGKKWIAGSVLKLVAMHDQLPDKQQDTTFTGEITATDISFSGTTTQGLQPKSLTTAERTALSLTGSDTAVVYDETIGEYYAWQSGAWVAVSSGSTQPNASETVAGKVELATTAEVTAGTDTGGTGASLVVTPGDLQASIQSGEALYAGASAVGTDAYAVTITPTLTAYTTGMRISFLADVANTGACTIDIDSLGVKNIKTLDGNDPQDGAVRIGHNTLVYDGTNMVLQSEDFAAADRKGIAEMLTDAEAITGTDETRYANALQVANRQGYTVMDDTDKIFLLQSADTERTTDQTSYTKLKEIVATVAGDYYVSFDIGEVTEIGGIHSYARIYKNGVAHGTEQSATGATYETKNETLTFAAGDLIQLYAKTDTPASTDTKVRNFQLFGVIKPQSLTLTVNTD